jgi:hypothetical protein
MGIDWFDCLACERPTAVRREKAEVLADCLTLEANHGRKGEA